MSKNETLRTWGLIIGLLLFGVVALIGWQWLSNQPRAGTADPNLSLPRAETPPLEIRLRDYNELIAQIEPLQGFEGEVIDPFVALGMLTVLTVLPMLLLGGLLAGLFILLDRRTQDVKAAPEFQTAATQLNRQEEERVKQLRTGRSAKPRRADPTMPRWAAISTSSIVVLFVMFLAFMLGRSFLPHEAVWRGNLVDPALLFMWGLALVTAVILYFSLRGRESALATADDADTSPPPWGWIWVIITGLLIVGLGTGLSLILRAAPAS